MSKLLRHYSQGNVYFVTSITHQRRPLLIEHFDTLWDSVRMVRSDAGFQLIAWAVLPDHYHLMIDPRKSNLSTIMQRIKMSFGTKLRGHRGAPNGRTWQPRFWDHMIRDQEDMNRHIDYIHYNAVKHGAVQRPFEWQYSSIHEDQWRGCYESDWGVAEPIVVEGEFGE